MKKSGKTFGLVLILILLVIFFFPKTSGRGLSIAGLESYGCRCLGLERLSSEALKTCYGMPYACVGGGFQDELDISIMTFEECVAAGYPVMESYPRQCRTEDGQIFTEDIYNSEAKSDLIQVYSPLPEQSIASPLQIVGKARGTWFFEATFPVILTNWDGLIIAEHYAQAQGDWMTEEFVPFVATLEFDSPVDENSPEFMHRGSLILKKDNPSGLPEYDDALEFTVYFE